MVLSSAAAAAAATDGGGACLFPIYAHYCSSFVLLQTWREGGAGGVAINSHVNDMAAAGGREKAAWRIQRLLSSGGGNLNISLWWYGRGVGGRATAAWRRQASKRALFS